MIERMVMTSDMEKNHKQRPITGSDESRSCAEGSKMNNESRSSIPRRNGEERPLFKKPRLDVSFVMVPEFQCDDGSILLRNCDRQMMRCDEEKGQQECSTQCVGECSTCGDTGFQSELFRCIKCSVRLQHTYCSNSYNPRNRWFIGLCNWCESDVSRSGTLGGAATAACKLQQQTATGTSIQTTNERDYSSSSPWIIEKKSAVDCLLGAALRLPNAGLSNMEEFLPRTAAKGRRSTSFDAVENAKRSGPSCDGAVKANKRLLGGSLSSSTTSSSVGAAASGDGKTQTSGGRAGGAKAATAVVTGRGGQRDAKPLVLKRSHPHHPDHARNTTTAAAVATCTAPGAAARSGREGKENSRETASSSDSVEERVESKSAGAGRSESEKLSSTKSTFKRSASMSVITKNKKSTVVDFDDKSETTEDNTLLRSSLRHSPSKRLAAATVVKSERDSPSGDEERKGKDGTYIRSTAGGSEKPKAAAAAAAQGSPSRETIGNSIRRSQDHKSSSQKDQKEGGSARAAAADRRIPGRRDRGGSDPSTILEAQRSGGDHGGHVSSSSGFTVLRKSQSFRLQEHVSTTQSWLLNRPNLIIGKSKTPPMVQSSRKLPDVRNSKLRRSSSSSRVSGVHFKCLSDILC